MAGRTMLAVPNTVDPAMRPANPIRLILVLAVAVTVIVGLSVRAVQAQDARHFRQLLKGAETYKYEMHHPASNPCRIDFFAVENRWEELMFSYDLIRVEGDIYDLHFDLVIVYERMGDMCAVSLLKTIRTRPQNAVIPHNGIGIASKIKIYEIISIDIFRVDQVQEEIERNIGESFRDLFS